MDGNAEKKKKVKEAVENGDQMVSQGSPDLLVGAFPLSGPLVLPIQL